MTYLISLVIGLAVGVAYGLLNVRSPAPPLVALVELLGMLIGQQAVDLAKRQFFSPSPHVAHAAKASSIE
jgi:XapX domain-containing protein